jgi:large subunit ribosomal protein L22
MATTMETKSIVRGVRLSADKGRLVADLKITQIYVEQGATLKRFSARAKGRGNRISKPTAHIYITVGN